jgi:multidrug efflux pump subunit AcrB
VKSFKDLVLVLMVSVLMIFMALVVGALAALWIMGQPFGFMAFLGIVSLVGVIVSHIIGLFDFIEEKHAEGAPLVEALLYAGIMRLTPVMIIVGATVIALFPLASHGDDIHHASSGTGDLCDLRAGSEVSEMGEGATN